MIALSDDIAILGFRQKDSSPHETETFVKWSQLNNLMLNVKSWRRWCSTKAVGDLSPVVIHNKHINIKLILLNIQEYIWTTIVAEWCIWNVSVLNSKNVIFKQTESFQSGTDVRAAVLSCSIIMVTCPLSWSCSLVGCYKLPWKLKISHRFKLYMSRLLQESTDNSVWPNSNHPLWVWAVTLQHELLGSTEQVKWVKLFSPADCY